MALTSKMSKMAMDRTKKFLNLPGYDMDTEDAIKELVKKRSTKEGLTPREEKALDRLMNKKVREESAEDVGEMARERKGRMLTDKEKKQMQESLEFSKGGMSKKMMGGGMMETQRGGTDYAVAPPKPKSAAKVKPAAAPKKANPMMAMAKGGCSTKKMRVGGMANCGASVKPNGPKKGK